MPKQTRKTTGKTTKATAKRLTKKVPVTRLVAPRATQEKGAKTEGVKMAAQKFTISGAVRNKVGKGLPKQDVRVYEKLLRNDPKLLGEATTDEKGFYTLTYTPIDAQKLVIVVKVFDAQGKEWLASAPLFNPKLTEQVDFMEGGGQYKGDSEYEKLIAELTPFLEGHSLADLNKDDIAFLAKKTGEDEGRITALATAHQLASKTKLPPEALYGLFRQNLPTSLPALLIQDQKVLRRALAKAIGENVIPLSLGDQTEGILQRLKELMAEQAFEKPEQPGQHSLGELLDTGKFATPLQQHFVEAYVQHEGPIESFWHNLEQNPEFGSDIVKNLQFTLQLGTLTQNHIPLVQKLQNDKLAGKLSDLRDLARLRVEDWEQLIGDGVGAPPDITAHDYATSLARQIEEAFPTAVIAHEVELDANIPGKEALSHFFQNNADFDLATTNVDLYAKDHGDKAFAGIKDIGSLVIQLKGVQRLFRLAPRLDRYKAIRTLQQAGFESAQSIARVGRKAFIRQHAEALGGEVRAREVHARAQHRAAMALTLLGQHSAAFHSVRVVGDWVDHVDGIPNWAELFGPPALCECEHCRSVYSPAAYLVDLLHWLKTDVGAKGSFTTGLEVLFSRRRDLGEIELSCDNANTPVPYVDLLNEILEDAVAPSTFLILLPASDTTTVPALDARTVPQIVRDGFRRNHVLLSDSPLVTVNVRSSRWRVVDDAREYKIRPWFGAGGGGGLLVSLNRQTHGLASELGANPEYLNQAAYDKLAQHVFYPWDLPFNLWAEEARAYLEHLGMRRHQLMEIFHPAQPPAELTDISIAGEYLGLTPREKHIITGPISSEPWTYWGYAPGPNTTWAQDLGAVPVFLQRSGLNYKELLEVLDTRFINQDRQIGITPVVGADPATCDLAELKITPLTEPALNKVHRFVRLQRKLGWTMRDLDRLFTAFGASDITDELLVKLAHVCRLRAALKVPLAQILSWWAPLDTAIYQVEQESNTKSLYDQLFLNKSVLNPEDRVFLLNPRRVELAIADPTPDPAQTIGANASAITAALGISAEDLALLTTDDALNLRNLSSLYRQASLARALKLSIRDLLSVRALTGIDPFNASQTIDALQFVEKVGRIRASGFRIQELDYLLRHKVEVSSSVALTEESIALLLTDIRDGLQKIAAETVFSPDPTGELTRRKLASILPDESAVTQAMALLEDGGVRSVAAKAEQDSIIDAHLTVFLDRAEAKTKLIGQPPDPPTLTEKPARFNYVLGPMLRYLQETLSQNLVIQKLGEAFKLETAIVEALLREGLTVPNTPSQKAITAFLDASFINSQEPPTASAFASLFQTVVKLHKAALIISKLRVRPVELRWIMQHGPDLGWLDLNGLPAGEEPPPIERFSAWQRLLDTVGLLDRYPALREKLTSDEWQTLRGLFGLPADALLPDGPALLALFDLANQFAGTDPVAAELEMWHVLNSRTGWNWSDDDYRACAQRFTITFPTVYRDERWLLRLQACFEVAKRVGISPQKMIVWANAEVQPEDARAVKQAVKAKYDEKQWPAIARPLRDVLREKQRAALVSYLMAQNGLTESNGLYQYYLIDPEMDPCMMTSRIKQAISSVQLFIQRGFMGLEPDVTLDADDAREWEWRKNYRVWEANRKVFLYPENWIEPELRDDKSPFFKDLENELLQNEITADTVETAYLHYLEKLDQVARLEMAGMYHQQEAPDAHGTFEIDILHVFGRTRNTPHLYYYRKWVNQSYWTPWERVDVDIEGDHLLPVVWNRRLHLYWPVFTEKAKEEVGEKDNPRPPTKYWEIKLAFSEYKNGKWAAKKVSQDILSVLDWGNFYSTYFDSKKSSIFFESVIANDSGLYIFFRTDYAASGRLAPSWFEIGACDSSVRVGGPAITTHERPLYYFTSDLSSFQTGTHLITEFLPLVELLNNLGVDPYKVWIPGTSPEFDKLKELGDHELSLIAADVLRGPRIYSEHAIVEVPVLSRTPSTFQILYSHQFQQFVSQTPFFYEDDKKTFFVLPNLIERQDSQGRLIWGFNRLLKAYRFQAFYHRYVCDFVKQLNCYGIDGLLNPDPNRAESADLVRQLVSDPFFLATYAPNVTVDSPYPSDTIDFTSSGAYSSYNWELFFHAPLLIADRLSKNQRFEEAQKWFHYIFDPTDTGIGLRAAYFANTELREPAVVTRVDPEVNFNWGLGSPDSAVPTDGFSVRWTGRVMPLHDGDYTFYTNTDDGVRLWVDNQLLIDHWSDQPAIEHPAMHSINLKRGKLYPIKMEFYENGGFAVAQLLWEGPQTAKGIIPQTRLYQGLPYWKVQPLFLDADPSQQIEQLMKLIHEGDEEVVNQVIRWRSDPFNPHLIAHLRLIAYQKNVVMKYIDNLIAWGDQLFRQDTIESINEAAQLYILAAEILGPRPELIPPRGTVPAKTYNELASAPGGLDAFSNALVQMESVLLGGTEPPPGGGTSGVPVPSILYFCIPKNDKLLGYWDIVADRMFKVRHCMTIEGVVRQLPLFEPPIDPALLVRARAAGVDLRSALNDVNAALPYYRFQVMLQKAIEFCGEVRNLGAALLSALEKRDAEALALLRSGHELELLNAVRQVKEKQIEEAQETLAGLEKAKLVTETRRDYYRDIKRINDNEQLHMDSLRLAQSFNEIAQRIQAGVAGAHAMPNFDVGTAGWAASPVVKASFGGNNLGSALQAAAGVLSMIAAQYTHDATMASIEGGFDRRWDEWELQKRLADKELEQIGKQIAAAEVRKAIAEADLKNHDQQIDNAKEVNAFMRDKFTNRELYDWMVGQVSTLYFQSYQLAYDLAKKAEKAFRHEIGDDTSTFVKFGYWDSLKKGLLAGERLHYDLKRMELAHLEQNKREYEITKHISLAMLDPVALIQLKQTGQCFVNLPEAIFDLDYPGHYMRRIKSVSLTIPCVTGPYASVNGTLTLQRHSTRIKSDAKGTEDKYGQNSNSEDLRFRDVVGAVQSIATSSAQNDSGLFELNFRDERYLPFEGAGAISTWQLQLSGKWLDQGKLFDFTQFDFNTISDVILHIHYTAREGNDDLRKQARAELADAIKQIALSLQGQGLARAFSLKREFPNEWHRLISGGDPAQAHVQGFQLTSDRFIFLARNKAIKITKMHVIAIPSSGSPQPFNFTNLTVTPPNYTPQPNLPSPDPNIAFSLEDIPDLSGARYGYKDYSQDEREPGEWTIMIEANVFTQIQGSIDDIWLACEYYLKFA